MEVALESSSFRSLASFVFCHSSEPEVFVWHGASSPSHTREQAKHFADNLVKDTPQEFKNKKLETVREEFEGTESLDFKNNVIMRNNSDYVESLAPPLKSPRLFHMTSVSGNFQVSEVLCPFRNQAVLNPLAFNQTDLYSVEQPGIIQIYLSKNSS